MEPIMKKGKLSNAEKQQIMDRMGKLSVKQIAKKLDRSETVVQNFTESIMPQNSPLPMPNVAPVNTPVDDQVKKLQDRIIQLEQEKLQPGNQWKGKVRMMTQAQSERLDTAMGRDPNSSSPITIQPSEYRPDCVIKPLNND